MSDIYNLTDSSLSAAEMYEAVNSPGGSYTMVSSPSTQGDGYPVHAAPVRQGASSNRGRYDRSKVVLEDGSLNKVSFTYGEKTVYLAPRPDTNANAEIKARVYDDAVTTITAADMTDAQRVEALTTHFQQAIIATGSRESAAVPLFLISK